MATADSGVIPDALKSSRSTWSDRAISEPVLATSSAAPPSSAAAATPSPRLVYKLGDLGHVTSVEKPRLQDGDSRYMAPELLRDDASDLARADVFSLGLSLYELARHVPLPKNDDEWQALRAGLAPRLPHISDELNQWLQVRGVGWWGGRGWVVGGGGVVGVRVVGWGGGRGVPWHVRVVQPITDASPGPSLLLKKAMLAPRAADRPTAQQLVERTSGPDELEGVLRALKEEKVKTASLQTQLDMTTAAASKDTRRDDADVSPSRRKLHRSHTTIF